jgi:4a-hydroxytetrahydrobiopterin dehydratase
LPTDRVYSEPEILQRLSEHPGWRYAEGSLARTYRTANFKATLMVVTTIGHLCELAWHHPELVVTYNAVVVKLSTHSAKGITDKDFELAAKIEEVIGWRPGKAGGALTGTPEDPRYAYIRDE